MKQPIRAFAIGLFVAGTIMLIVYYFSSGKEIDISAIPIEEVKEQLTEDGYRVLTEDEYISLSVEKDLARQAENEEIEESENTSEDEQVEETDDEANSDNTEEQEDENQDIEEESVEDEEEVVTYTLTIEAGLPSSAISETLQEQNIIDDANAFTDYLEDEGYSLRIQLGEFTLSSDMSFYEIAETLTK